MKNSKYCDVVVSVNYEFAKRCTLSEPILSRLADDLIARYSPKHHPHPDFFKEDAALALNQLTLYIDQFIQVMRNYQFLEKAATIISSLTTACLRINDFLSKQLYHYMKSNRAQTPKRSAVSQFLCPACGKQRQNQKIRVMRDELHMPRVDWNATKIVREVVGRNGEKYDVEELIYEQMENLDTLNEEEMRKRLQHLELDHDRRKQEMMVCLQQLKRANDRVTGYSKTIDKKGKDWDGKFNVRDYVFQLSRHFYHNLSNLDHKIKQLKQNMNPIGQKQTQTQEPCVMISEHNNVVDLLNQKIAGLEVSIHESKTMLMIEQKKFKEDEQTIKYLQEKLGTQELERQEEKLQSTLTEKHLNAQLALDQNKISSLQNLVKKLKHITKVRNLGLEEDWDDQFIIKTQTVEIQVPQLKENKSAQVSNEFKDKYYSKTFKDNRIQWKESLLLNPNNVMTTDSLDMKNIQRGRESLKIAKKSTPALKNKPSWVREERKDKLVIVSSFSQMICPEANSSKSLHFKITRCHSRSIDFSPQEIEGLSSKDQVVDPIDDKKSKKVRLNKLDSNKRQIDKKITTINSRKNVLILQNERSSHQGKESVQGENQYWAQTLKARNERLKNTMFEVQIQKNELFMERKHSKYQSRMEGRENQLNAVFRPKKRRNFSQEHSLQDKDNYDYRRSVDRNVWNEKTIFAELNNVLHVHKSPSQFQKKYVDKRNLPSRGDYLKTALSLQQISFSTNVYSLAANLHLKNPSTYFYLKKYFCLLSGYNSQDENSIKNSLKIILISHRKCSGNGSICGHLQNLLEKIKSM